MADIIPGTCAQCQATGLPILPVRYAVVPRNVQPALPGWASGERVSSVDVGGDFHYALRLARTGYIYVFYEKNARGNNQWECYSVGQDASLTRFMEWRHARPQETPELHCTRHGPVNTQVHYLVIEQPEKCATAWIAFTQDLWSEDTVREYTGNPQLRNARMQTLHPAQMIAGAKHSHGAIASKETLEQVLEYSPTLSTVVLPYDGHTGQDAQVKQTVGTLSREDGSVIDGRLEKMSTRYPWALRPERAEATAVHMQGRAKAAGGKPGTPHVLALWDAVGMAHELNGFRNDAAGWIARYGDERALQLTALTAIQGAQKALETKAGTFSDRMIEQVRAQPDLYEARETRARTMLRANPGDKAAQQELADVLAERAKHQQTSRQGAEDFKRTNIARAWPRYAAKLNRGALDDFQRNSTSFFAQADTLINRRTVPLIRWLEAPLLLDTLEDFHHQNIADGLLFEAVVGDACFGIGSCKAGQTKIDEWVKEAKASTKGNLLWRAIALNQQEGIEVVDAALQHVYAPSVPLAQNIWDQTGGQIKFNKLEDLVKKSLTFFNTQMKALHDPSSGIAPVERTRGLENIFATVGGAWLKPLVTTVDTINETMLRTLLLVRSGATTTSALALAAWEIRESAQSREELLRRLANANHYIGAGETMAMQAQAKKWADLRADAEVPDPKRKNFNAARDNRLALVVAVFEAFNLYKTGRKAAETPGSEQIQAQLKAAQLATAAAAIDVMSNFVKGVAQARDLAVTYQVLKGMGGGLSAVASGYGASLDWDAGRKTWHAEDYRLGAIYFIRSAFQYLGATLTLLTAFSYCSPLIEAFGKRFGERLAGRVLTATAKWLIGMRAALIFSGLEVSIFVLAVSVTIWGFEDDALEKWCNRCAFGSGRKLLADAYEDADSQIKAYGEALKEVK